jgi:hypothetical protein
MTFPETLNTKVAVNKLSFPLVTHMAYKDAWFDSYAILKSGRGVEKLSGQTVQAGEQSGFKPEDARILVRVVYKFHTPLTQLSNAYSHAHFW